MSNLFTPNVPVESSPMKSAEVRNNFTAIFDKLKTLEARATSPLATSVIIEGGPVYFRSGTATRLSLINFKTTVINLATTRGYATIKNSDGSLTREQLPSNGVSPFSTIGLFREILISLTNTGKLVFTEAAKPDSSTGLSRPFDIYFADEEVPICLIVIKQSGTLLTYGQLATVEQIDITDVRPFVTTAFQNNSTVANLQDAVEDNQDRLDALEPSLRVTEALQVRLPSVEKMTIDGTLFTNTKLEVVSGDVYIGNRLLRFPGGTVDLTGADQPGYLPTNNFNKALVGLQITGSGPALTVVHGVYVTPPGANDSKTDRFAVQVPISMDDGYGGLFAPTGILPLALISYRLSSTVEVPASGPDPDRTRIIKPIISSTHIDNLRVDHDFDIVGINSPVEFIVQIPTDVNPDDVFNLLQSVDIYDDNTRPLRRVVDNDAPLTFDSLTRNMTIRVTESVVEIVLLRHAKMRAVNLHRPVIDDIRPFIGRT